MSPNEFWVLSGRGDSLGTRFRRLGDLSDLGEAISMYRGALALPPSDQDLQTTGNRVRCLSNLGHVLAIRFENLGNLGDINESLQAARETVELLPADDSFKARCLANFGTCLQRRFEQLGDLSDINQSMSVLTEAVRLSLTTEEKCVTLMLLSDCLYIRFERLGELDDMNNSVMVAKKAVTLCPNDDPRRSACLNCLGGALQRRFDRLHILSDMHEAIVAFKEANRLVTDDNPAKVRLLAHLGQALYFLFLKSENLSDLNDGISAMDSALRLCPAGHPMRTGQSLSLSLATWARFAITLTVSMPSLSQPQPHVRKLQHLEHLQSQEYPTRFRLEMGTESMPAYRAALHLLPELSWLGLSIRDRHHYIGTSAGRVVRDAVGAAIGACEYVTAVEWFERGRSVVWGQILELRTPVDALKQSHPDLAERFILRSRQLEDAGTREIFAHARDMLLEEIRALDKFDRFLLLKAISELTVAAERGPVVILNVSSEIGALVLMPGLDDEVLYISLPNFSKLDLVAVEESLGRLLPGHGRGERLDGRREGQMPPEVEFAHVLSELWKRVAWPILQGLGYTTPSKDPQHIWWCLTGPLTFIPIHAAGLYGEDDAFGSKLSDFVISSYTPSLTALIEAFRGESHPQELQFPAVAQPSAHGQPYIPGTQKEIDDIQQLVRAVDPKIPVLRFDGNAATLDSVKKAMRDSRYVHFACHGVQSASDPTESALLLAGSSRLTLSEIIKMNLPHANLAFLSACHTATGAKNLEEESVHLAAGMMLAGYRSVIATMWSIMDDDDICSRHPQRIQLGQLKHYISLSGNSSMGPGERNHFSTGYRSYVLEPKVMGTRL
ncbi:CHAT domain-containing protein [Mycena leptocephala]|nr:CHAT domain-containing protein [Mycena leptocephala]